MNKPLVITLLAITVAALSATAALRDKPKSKQDYVFSGKPVVEFEGRITHATTGAGIPEVYVLVNMRTYRAVPFTHHGVSGCQDSSQVVKTDAEGRYRVYWSWAEHNEEVPDDLSVQLKIYKPGWEYYPVVRPRISWYSVDEQHDFKLVEDGAPFEHRLDFVRRVMGDNCPAADTNPAGIEMAEAVYQEVWEGFCQKNEPPRTVADLLATAYVLSGAYHQLFDNRRVDLPEKERTAISGRRYRALKELAPDLPWSKDWRDIEVQQLSHELQQAYCAFLAPEAQSKWMTP